MQEHSEPDRDGPESVEPGPEQPEQLVLMQRMVDLSVERTRLAEQRTEMSAERSYLNAERTLSVWIRTALAVMVVGIAVGYLAPWAVGFLTELQVGTTSIPIASRCGARWISSETIDLLLMQRVQPERRAISLMIRLASAPSRAR